MSAPLYQNTQVEKKPDHAHAGLWFERFFNGYESDWTIADTAKQTWIKSVTGLQGDTKKLGNYSDPYAKNLQNCLKNLYIRAHEIKRP